MSTTQIQLTHNYSQQQTLKSASLPHSTREGLAVSPKSYELKATTSNSEENK